MDTFADKWGCGQKIVAMRARVRQSTELMKESHWGALARRALTEDDRYSPSFLPLFSATARDTNRNGVGPSPQGGNATLGLNQKET